jgi:hypothetical protein
MMTLNAKKGGKVHIDPQSESQITLPQVARETLAHTPSDSISLPQVASERLSLSLIHRQIPSLSLSLRWQEIDKSSCKTTDDAHHASRMASHLLVADDAQLQLSAHGLLAE